MEIKLRPSNCAAAYADPKLKIRKRPQTRQARDEERERRRKKKEERLLKLAEYGSPERQRLSPRPQDRLNLLSPWHLTVVMTGVVILILGLFALVTIAQGRNKLGLEVSRLVREQTRLQETNGRLKARIEELVILEDLEVIARENLNLQTPRKGQIYVLE